MREYNNMNLVLVNELSSSSEIDVLSAIFEIEDNPEYFSSEIILALSNIQNVADSLLAAFCRRRFPFFSDPHVNSEKLSQESFGTGNRSFQQEKIYLGGVRNLLIFLKSANTDLIKVFNVLAGQKALLNEYRFLIENNLGLNALESFNTAVNRHKPEIKRQIGIAPTFTCNLSCEYCFSKNKNASDMEPEHLESIIKWSADHDVKLIRLFGGEATFYRSFDQLIQCVRKHGLKTYFASNCIMNDHVLSLLDSNIIETIYAHIQGPENSRNLLFELFWKNVNILHDKNIEILLRYNLIDEDWSYILEKKPATSDRRIAFAPVVSYCSADYYTDDNWYEQIELSKKFVLFMENNGMIPVLSRPQPLCFIESIDNNHRWDIFSGNCSIYLDDCLYNTLVWPDGRIALCDGETDPRKKYITDFENWDDLKNYVRPRVNDWLKMNLFSKCDDCYYKKRALCQGSCLASKNRL